MARAFAKDVPGAILNFFATLVGVYLAFLLSNVAQDQADRGSYRALVRAVSSEAKSNEAVYQSSIVPFMGHGVVLRDYSVVVAQQTLASPLFIKYAGEQNIQTLTKYLRDLLLSNSYRAADADLVLHNGNDQW